MTTEQQADADEPAPGSNAAATAETSASAQDEAPHEDLHLDAALAGESAPVERFSEASALPLRTQLEAVLLVADEPVDELRLAQVLRVPRDDIAAELVRLSDDLRARGSGIDLRRSGAGWRLYTAAECAPVVEQFLLEGQTARLSQAALETLTIVAYRQPVSRGRISGIRGVNVDGVVRTLLTRGLLTEVGTDPESASILYGTTELFLEKLELQSLRDLPSLAPLMPEIDDLENA